MKSMTLVRTELPNTYFGATEGRRCLILRSYFRNGEGWYRLQDVQTEETFDSPDIFWAETAATESRPPDMTATYLGTHTWTYAELDEA